MLTAAELLAEPLLYPDDAPVVVIVPDRAQPSIEAVRPIVSAGAGRGLMPDEITAAFFSLRAGE
ncbi:hypothetical protein [Cellulomonas sp. Root137]|uniref:hypothetical protein n=1 Tax=Cellulomonas sp. Root137 TaxID=1736459 RepID=UPI0006F7FFD9|nr:hypothetical protein [Cellulomonas sp. Root137]KQY44343.1 hypothetical protein ASD18_12430 [Cellulomonas sp. Root137]